MKKATIEPILIQPSIFLYKVSHVTRFAYSNMVSEAQTELRMQPQMDDYQTLRHFKIETTPRARMMNYIDHWGNQVYHFGIAGEHRQLLIKVESEVEVRVRQALPLALSMDTWVQLKSDYVQFTYWDYLNSSYYIKESAYLSNFIAALQLPKDLDPLQWLLTLNNLLFKKLKYSAQSTHVDSHIDTALSAQKGVCQDYAHIFIAISRQFGIPCRYVSGYLYHANGDQSVEGESHAWVEAWLPQLGWIGLDPTNDMIAELRHIRVAYGRDYADVPPTKGTFRGNADTKLGVSVWVAPVDIANALPNVLPELSSMSYAKNDSNLTSYKNLDLYRQQQQQQQQQGLSRRVKLI